MDHYGFLNKRSNECVIYMYDKYRVGNRLATFRENNHLSQEFLAEKLGCSVVTISRWENGLSSMKDEHIFHICEILHISSDKLLGVQRGQDISKDSIDFLLKELSENQRKIVYVTIQALIHSMKECEAV